MTGAADAFRGGSVADQAPPPAPAPAPAPEAMVAGTQTDPRHTDRFLGVARALPVAPNSFDTDALIGWWVDTLMGAARYASIGSAPTPGPILAPPATAPNPHTLMASPPRCNTMCAWKTLLNRGVGAPGCGIARARPIAPKTRDIAATRRQTHSIAVVDGGAEHTYQPATMIERIVYGSLCLMTNICRCLSCY